MHVQLKRVMLLVTSRALLIWHQCSNNVLLTQNIFRGTILVLISSTAKIHKLTTQPKNKKLKHILTKQHTYYYFRVSTQRCSTRTRTRVHTCPWSLRLQWRARVWATCWRWSCRPARDRCIRGSCSLNSYSLLCLRYVDVIWDVWYYFFYVVFAVHVICSIIGENFIFNMWFFLKNKRIRHYYVCVVSL